MVRLLRSEHKKSWTELAAFHVEAVRQFAKSGENGKVLQLPGGVDVRRDDDALVFMRGPQATKKAKRKIEYAYPVKLDGGETQIAVKEIVA